MHSITDIDLGTPAVASDHDVEVFIDGRAVRVPAGISVMRAAALAGIPIPKLCATDTLAAFGSCRLCVVEVEGVRGTPASCTTPVAAGMRITTENGRLADIRRGVMELYISDHPLDCLTCPANGNCELQDMAGVVGLREVRYGVGAAAGEPPPEKAAEPARSHHRDAHGRPLAAATAPPKAAAVARSTPLGRLATGAAPVPAPGTRPIQTAGPGRRGR